MEKILDFGTDNPIYKNRGGYDFSFSIDLWAAAFLAYFDRIGIVSFSFIR